MAPFYSTTAHRKPLFPGSSIVQMTLLVPQVASQLAQGFLKIFTTLATICHHLAYPTLVNQGHLLGYPGPGPFLTSLGQPSGSSVEVF